MERLLLPSDIYTRADIETVRVDLHGFTVIRPADFHTSSAWRVERLAERIAATTGTPCPVCDAATEAVPAARVLLLGSTACEAREALAELQGAGFVIRIGDDTISICGTTNYLTQLGMVYFAEHFLKDDGTALLPRCTICEGFELLPLADSEQCRFALVYNRNQDDDSGNCPEPHGPGNKETNPDQVDFGVHACKRLGELLVKLTGCEETSVLCYPETQSGNDPEILMGCMDRPAARMAHADLRPDEYGFLTDGRDVVILAWNDTALMRAYGLFDAALRESYVTDALGYRTYYLPANTAEIRRLEIDWRMDFPKPDADTLTLSETVDVGDQSLEYIYEGTGAVRENYDTYCENLLQSGFERYSEHDIQDNLFSTFVNRETDTVLNVSLRLLPYRETYGVCHWKPGLRVVSAPLSRAEMIGSRELDPAQTYTRLTDTMLTSVQQDRLAKSVLGTFYVLTLEDGSFFILDGGQNRGTIGTDYYLWNMLNKLYERTHGHKPTKEDPIVIAGWFLTHAHDDHLSTLRAFCQRYCDPHYPLRFENFFANLLSSSEHFNVCGVVPEQTWESLLGGFTSRVRCVKLHTGDRFYLRNAAFEVLYTHEDMHPFMLDYYNESSTVMRVTLRHTDGAGRETGVPVQWLLTGDMNRYTGKLMLAMYGDYLESEMITVAHHGWVGPRRIFYDIVSPKILWWPTFIRDFKYMTKEGQQNHSWYHMRVNYYIAHDLPSVRYIFVQDTYDTTLVLGERGIDYDRIEDSLFDLMDERPILFNADSHIRKHLPEKET